MCAGHGSINIFIHYQVILNNDDEGDDFGEGEAFGDADGASLAMAMPIMATKMSARTS